MTNKPRKEVRVKKARRSATMACGHYVIVGHRIVSRNGGRWKCFECAMKEVRE